MTWIMNWSPLLYTAGLPLNVIITECLIVYHCVGLNMDMSSQPRSSQSGELISDDLQEILLNCTRVYKSWSDTESSSQQD